MTKHEAAVVKTTSKRDIADFFKPHSNNTQARSNTQHHKQKEELDSDLKLAIELSQRQLYEEQKRLFDQLATQKSDTNKSSGFNRLGTNSSSNNKAASKSNSVGHTLSTSGSSNINISRKRRLISRDEDEEEDGEEEKEEVKQDEEEKIEVDEWFQTISIRPQQSRFFKSNTNKPKLRPSLSKNKKKKEVETAAILEKEAIKEKEAVVEPSKAAKSVEQQPMEVDDDPVEIAKAVKSEKEEKEELLLDIDDLDLYFDSDDDGEEMDPNMSLSDILNRGKPAAPAVNNNNKERDSSITNKSQSPNTNALRNAVSATRNTATSTRNTNTNNHTAARNTTAATASREKKKATEKSNCPICQQMVFDVINHASSCEGLISDSDSDCSVIDLIENPEAALRRRDSIEEIEVEEITSSLPPVFTLPQIFSPSSPPIEREEPPRNYQAEEEDDGYLSPLEGFTNINENNSEFNPYFAQLQAPIPTPRKGRSTTPRSTTTTTKKKRNWGKKFYRKKKR